MTVRVLLRDEPREVVKPARARWLEYAFLLVGLVAVDYYLWINVQAAYYQDFQSWSFDQQLHSRPVSYLRFVEAKLGLLHDDSDTTPNPSPVKSGENTDTEAHAAPSHPTRIKPLSVIGRIEVPRLRLAAMVREGTGEDTLERAVGHIPSTAMPGQPGNVGLAGHRDTFFRKLQGIRKDDRIVVSTLQGKYEYQVQSTRIVTPRDVAVLKPDATGQSLTLVTCYPFYYVGSAPKRFVVRARQVEATPQQPQTGS